MLKKYMKSALDGEDLTMVANSVVMNTEQVGERCVIQRHDQVIAKQRAAIAELRDTVSRLEEATASFAIPNFALNRISNLKKSNEQLEEKMSAEISLARERIANLTDQKLYSEVCRLTEKLDLMSGQLDQEKSTTEEIREALHSSEEIYFKCIRRLNNQLGIKEVLGCKPLSDNENPSIVIMERNKGTEIIANHIKNLKSRIQREEELLGSYDHDMKKLRDTEKDFSKKCYEVKYLETELEEKKDEISYLQEALRKSRSECDDLRRANSSLRENKQLSIDYKRGSKR